MPMKVICVDDERLLMEDTVAMCLALDQVEEARGFTKAADALAYLEGEKADVALLDINMPGTDGMQLAKIIREKWTDTAIIFLTGYTEYALDAFAVHASGYLLKPVKKDQLAAEIAYAAGKRGEHGARVEARTFGNFDLLLDGKPVVFRQAKCKELLAYLIDRHGANVTRREAFAILYEDRMYDRPMQKQFDVIIRALRTTLTEYGIGEIFQMGNAAMRIDPALISCDAWRYLQGEPEAIHAFVGEYMSNYAWARLTESTMAWKAMNRN